MLTNPFYVLTFMFGNQDKVLFLLQLLAPVLFLPLLSGQAWIVALPALAIPLLVSFKPQYSLGYHYVALLLPFLYYLAAAGVVLCGGLAHRPGGTGCGDRGCGARG